MVVVEEHVPNDQLSNCAAEVLRIYSSHRKQFTVQHNFPQVIATRNCQSVSLIVSLKELTLIVPSAAAAVVVLPRHHLPLGPRRLLQLLVPDGRMARRKAVCRVYREAEPAVGRRHRSYEERWKL